MEAYDNLLTVVQSLADGAYHKDRHELDQVYRGVNYEFPVDEVNDQIILAVKALVQEIENRFNHLAVLEMSQHPTACNHMRSLVWALAAHELRVYAEGYFSFEPIETRVPQEAPADIPESKYQKVAEAIVEHFSSPRSTIAPHFMYDASTGTVVTLHTAPAKEEPAPSADPHNPVASTSGHTRWVFTSTPEERRYNGQLAEFCEKVHRYRTHRCMKRRTLAVALGITKKALRSVEYGQVEEIGDGPLHQNHPFVVRVAQCFHENPSTFWPGTE
jgi:DNA-binding XRE family transcriptional regulator